jgi:hypothetical protein
MRPCLLMTLAIATTALGCAGARAPEETLTSDLRIESELSCPAVATACPRGCYAVQAHPVDGANRCLQARRTFGCSPFDTVGPPAVTCSVSPDSTVWVSFEARLHPQGRLCTDREQEALGYPRCP